MNKIKVAQCYRELVDNDIGLDTLRCIHEVIRKYDAETLHGASKLMLQQEKELRGQ
jgi:hypothetical protein